MAERLLLIAAAPLAASLAVLAIGAVGTGTWMGHLLAIGLTFVLAVAGNRLTRLARPASPAGVIILCAVAGIAAPLLSGAPGPNRWVAIGPLNLYMAALVLPSFLAACAVNLRRGHGDRTVLAAALGVSGLLAAQPDASQALALLAGMTVAFVRLRANRIGATLTLTGMAIFTAWTSSRPDPLAPVPYVEGVFTLAFGHSLLAGLAVTASAILFVIGLWICSFCGAGWLSSVAAYYAVLFGCSVAGLTPAPLLGYGAGPLLGFGLLVAVSAWVQADASREPGRRARRAVAGAGRE